MLTLVVRALLVNLAIMECSFVAGVTRQRIFTVQVCRHCERESKYEFGLALNPDEDFTVPQNCTMTGVEHEHSNGEYMRKFLGDFISETYSATEVYTQTSWKQRTIDSARAQLEGLYGDELEWPNVDDSFTLNTITNASADMLLHLTDDNCPRLSQMLDKVENHYVTKQMMAQIDKDLEKTLFPDLRELANLPDASTQEMHNLCDYIYWMNVNDIELKFDLTTEQFNQCQVSFQRPVFRKFDGDWELTQLVVFEFAQNLV